MSTLMVVNMTGYTIKLIVDAVYVDDIWGSILGGPTRSIAQLAWDKGPDPWTLEEHVLEIKYNDLMSTSFDIDLTPRDGLPATVDVALQIYEDMIIMSQTNRVVDAVGPKGQDVV